jgi:hypothetical protein
VNAIVQTLEAVPEAPGQASVASLNHHSVRGRGRSELPPVIRPSPAGKQSAVKPLMPVPWVWWWFCGGGGASNAGIGGMGCPRRCQRGCSALLPCAQRHRCGERAGDWRRAPLPPPRTHPGNPLSGRSHRGPSHGQVHWSVQPCGVGGGHGLDGCRTWSPFPGDCLYNDVATVACHGGPPTCSDGGRCQRVLAASTGTHRPPKNAHVCAGNTAMLCFDFRDCSGFSDRGSSVPPSSFPFPSCPSCSSGAIVK